MMIDMNGPDIEAVDEVKALILEPCQCVEELHKEGAFKVLWNRLATLQDSSRSLCTNKRSALGLAERGNLEWHVHKHWLVDPGQLARLY